mgnify:FL=1
MATTVTIINTAASTVSLKPANKSVTTVAVRPASNVALGDITNVNVANASNGQALIFNSATGKFESQTFTLDANNITIVSGGLF